VGWSASGVFRCIKKKTFVGLSDHKKEMKWNKTGTWYHTHGRHTQSTCVTLLREKIRKINRMQKKKKKYRRPQKRCVCVDDRWLKAMWTRQQLRKTQVSEPNRSSEQSQPSFFFPPFLKRNVFLIKDSPVSQWWDPPSCLRNCIQFKDCQMFVEMWYNKLKQAGWRGGTCFHQHQLNTARCEGSFQQTTFLGAAT